jgi:hypothetical protein
MIKLADTTNADGTTRNASYGFDANGNPNAVTDGLNRTSTTLFDELPKRGRA